MRGLDTRAPLLILIAGLALSMSSTTAQEQTGAEAPWHRFHDKEGHQIEARVVSLSPDWRQVQIERNDGLIFDLAITRLSLDDQQYLRNWILNRELPDPASLRFDLNFTRHETPVSKEKLSTPIEEALWEAHEIGYRVSITNLSRTPLARLRLEYCLLLEDAVEVRPMNPALIPALEVDEAMPRWRPRRNRPLNYHFGSLELPLLAFNRPHLLDTATLVRDAVSPGRDNRLDLEDRVVGIMTRIVSDRGIIIAEKTDLIREYSALDWQVFAHRRDPSESDGKGELIEAIVAN